MPIYKADGKKDGLQKYQVRVNFVSDDGQSKQLTRIAFGLEAAKELERKLNNDIKEKGSNSIRKMTVQQLFDLFIAAKKYELRESTIDKHRRNYRLYVHTDAPNACPVDDGACGTQRQTGKVGTIYGGLSHMRR